MRKGKLIKVGVHFRISFGSQNFFPLGMNLINLGIKRAHIKYSTSSIMMDINISELSGVCDKEKRMVQQQIRRMRLAIIALSLLLCSISIALVLALVIKKESAGNDDCGSEDHFKVVPVEVTPYEPLFDVIEA